MKKYVSAVICVALLGVVGCASKEKKGEYREGDARDMLRDRLSPVYFDFDRSEIRLDARNTLERHYAYLKENRNVKIQIEGHCDERGTEEYNIALGERRALAIKNFLVAKGIDKKRLTFISYGEERPADPGHSEAAWAMNRRAEFVMFK